MVFFATMIDNFASQSFCGYAADNTRMHGQGRDIPWTEMDILQTEHGRFADRVQTFCGYSTDVLQLAA